MASLFRFSSIRRREEEENLKLPPDWDAVIVDDSPSEGPTFEYHSSDGQVYHSLRAAIEHLFSANVVVPKRQANFYHVYCSVRGLGGY